MRKEITDRFPTVGSRLKDERKKQGLARSRLATISCVPYSTIAEIENEQQKTSTRLHDLAAAFPKRLRIEWLADGVGPRYADSPGGGESPPQRVYFQILEADLNNLDPEIRRDVVALVKSIQEAVKRSREPSQDFKPSSKSRRV